MEKRAYCESCEEAFYESELPHRTPTDIRCHLALGTHPESICHDCAEARFDADQEKLARGWV